MSNNPIQGNNNAGGLHGVTDDTIGDDELFIFTLRPMTSRFLVLPDTLKFK